MDPEASELVMPEEPVKTGVPSNFVIRTKDQDSKLVFVDGMKVCSMSLSHACNMYAFMISNRRYLQAWHTHIRHIKCEVL